MSWAALAGNNMGRPSHAAEEMTAHDHQAVSWVLTLAASVLQGSVSVADTRVRH